MTFFGLGRAGLPLDAGVDVLGVLAEDDDVDLLRLLTATGRPRSSAPGGCRRTGRAPGAASRSADRMPPPTGVVSGPLIATRNSCMASDGLLGQPVVELLERLLAGVDLHPGDLALAAVCFFDRRVEHAHRGAPDIIPQQLEWRTKKEGRRVRRPSLSSVDLLTVDQTLDDNVLATNDARVDVAEFSIDLGKFVPLFRLF